MIKQQTPKSYAPHHNARNLDRYTMCHQQRRGAATIEFAVCLPVIILLVFGAIEASNFIFLKQSLNVAAYEGVREAIRNDSSGAESQRVAETILNSRQVRDFQIRFPAGSSDATRRGEAVTIEVSAPTETNSPLAGKFVNNRTLTARVTMMKE